MVWVKQLAKNAVATGNGPQVRLQQVRLQQMRLQQMRLQQMRLQTLQGLR